MRRRQTSGVSMVGRVGFRHRGGHQQLLPVGVRAGLGNGGDRVGTGNGVGAGAGGSVGVGAGGSVGAGAGGSVGAGVGMGGGTGRRVGVGCVPGTLKRAVLL